MGLDTPHQGDSNRLPDCARKAAKSAAARDKRRQRDIDDLAVRVRSLEEEVATLKQQQARFSQA